VETPNNNHTHKIYKFQYAVRVKGYTGKLSLILEVTFNIGCNMCAGFHYSLGKNGVTYHKNSFCDSIVYKV
jgi:hypothetical protein